jgi:hypothetical protein
VELEASPVLLTLPHPPIDGEPAVGEPPRWAVHGQNLVVPVAEEEENAVVDRLYINNRFAALIATLCNPAVVEPELAAAKALRLLMEVKDIAECSLAC